MIRKTVFGTVMAFLVIVALTTQAGAYLLDMPSPAPRLGSTVAGLSATGGMAPVAEHGPRAVGVRTVDSDEAPVAMTLWYPAVEPEEIRELAYAYGVTIFSPDSSVAFATFPGHATPGAAYDLTGGPYPLVVVSPGFAVTGSSYAWLAEQVVSHGFVVVAPEHRESLDPSGLWRATINRPVDVLAVLDHLDIESRLGGEYGGLIDIGTVAVVGHSYGGYTAIATAGARLDTEVFSETCAAAYADDDPLTFQCDALDGRSDDMAALSRLERVPTGLWPAVADDRIRAVVSIAGDAAMFGTDGLKEVTVPVMAIGGTADTDSPFAWGTRFAYEHVSSTRKIEIALEGAGHMVFAGGCDHMRRVESLVSLGFCSDPGWDRHEAHDIVEHYVTTFLRAELRADPDARAALAPSRQDVPEITYRAEGF
ncbi:MAG: alpha/beta fold hydrolase [Armatimonadetes bacterium]|nr:MAG: alpha/beta fold hydrolase [Armatimonadota bacterium]